MQISYFKKKIECTKIGNYLNNDNVGMLRKPNTFSSVGTGKLVRIEGMIDGQSLKKI